jgi:hypothetical protein
MTLVQPGNGNSDDDDIDDDDHDDDDHDDDDHDDKDDDDDHGDDHDHGTHGVPDLQLDLVAVDVDESCTELDSDGEVVYGLESLIGELEQQTTGIG